MVGALLMSCESFGEALEDLLEYYPIVGEGSTFELQRDAERVFLAYTPGYGVRVESRVEAVLASLLHLSRWITGERVEPLALCFQHPALAEYIALLNCPLSFAVERSGLIFKSSDLAVPLIQANAPMRTHLRSMADTLLERLGTQSLTVRVQQLLRSQPRWGKERVAEQLQLSGRHLNRKLLEEGTSFKLLREQLLYQMAEQLLAESCRQAEIAERLGFSDESAFAKAFRRWSGMTPGQFRQGLDS